MIMTHELRKAAVALADYSRYRGVDPSRAALVQDIRERAAELASLSVPNGTELTPYQVGYLQCLRSRLNDFCISGLTVVTEFQDAFSDAYNAKQEG